MRRKRHSVGKTVEEQRSAVFAALWNDPRYLRLDKAKDLALKKWNQIDAYKNMHTAEELRKASEAVQRALRRRNKYEDEALRKAGLTP